MNPFKQPFHNVLHHRLLEGILLRLARLPEPDHFILRGGMLMRLWFRPVDRRAGDLDLVANFPFDIEETGQRFLPILSDQSVNDGVVFDADRHRVEGIWLNSGFPGVRIFLSGEADEMEGELSVDITFNEPMIPPPDFADYPMAGCELTAQLWMCRPETILGRKLHALLHMGMLHWRPKDLNDLRLLLQLVPMDHDALPDAIVASFTSRGYAPDLARQIFSDESWWRMKKSSARWQDFATATQGMRIPRDLMSVVTEVSEQLEPILERLP